MEVHEIIMRSLPEGTDYRTVLPAIIGKSGMKGADSVQIGNSFFVYYKKGSAAFLEGYVQDTGRTAIKNYVKLFRYLQSKGITHVTVISEPERDSTVQAAKILQKYFEGTDTFVGIKPPNTNGEVIIHIKIGEDTIRKI